MKITVLEWKCLIYFKRDFREGVSELGHSFYEFTGKLVQQQKKAIGKNELNLVSYI